MKSAVLYTFSGTGNTQIIAGFLKDHLEQQGYRTDLVRMEDVLKGLRTADVEGYDLVGIGCQVIGFTAPSLFRKFLGKLPRGRGKKAFVFRTAGGVAPVNYNASKSLIGRLRRRGYDVFHERLFSISSNWISRFDDDVIVRLHQAARRKTGLMAEALVRGEPRLLKTGFGLRLMMGSVAAVAPVFFRLVGKDFTVEGGCNRCGLCVRNCPAGNIRDRKQGIRFGLSCNACLRCLYSCPQKALQLHRFASFAVPGGYDIRQILARPQVVPQDKKRPEPPFLERYLADDSL